MPTLSPTTNLYTHDFLLGGRLVYNQLAAGYRTGIEPVLLSAFIPAKRGDAVIEGGCGTGAGLMCLAHRVPGIRGFGLEQDQETTLLARENFSINNFQNLQCIHATIPHIPSFMMQDAASGKLRFDHAFANPPWHADSGTPSPNPRREAARRLLPGMLSEWIASLARLLKQQGTLTLILPTGLYPQACQLMEKNSLGRITLFPLWPKAGKQPKIILIQAYKYSAGMGRILPGLTLHQEDGKYSQEAKAVLQEGHSLLS
ncbi:tRNA1(Val) (adenine(37)-N6)-methyltransferase [Entomobacter blattae]|uniref:tRNA1(Val) (Adenine(37)-N6)-methyltransferase n=1 Tax=Entomobacter blattae TaxID=2762277 RepID=A0A7H1NNK1_9PROT|nr:tRNA1(Val) (adenine(37)-N6)-methyltransferase [Entomobacter blattae]